MYVLAPCIHINMLKLVVASLLLASCLGWPSGAPEDACSDRLPSHGPKSKVGSGGTFVIDAPASASPGQVIKVVLRGGNFKGFMVQGVAAKTSQSPPVGNFVGGNTINCAGGLANTATHNNPSKQDYTSQTVMYKVPAGASTIYLRATIVQKYLKYFPNVFSGPISVV